MSTAYIQATNVVACGPPNTTAWVSITTSSITPHQLGTGTVFVRSLGVHR